jgi:uridine monophosphate synthetase
MPGLDFFPAVTARAALTGSLLCVGLDPRASTAALARDECFRLIDLTAEHAVAFKPNSAFFEAHGPEGLAALRDVIAHVPAGIPVILDAKRGDIASTSQAYAAAAFDALGAHALTVSPYVGLDGLEPFLSRPGRAAFILCKTSNPGADQFQGLPVNQPGGPRPLFEIVAEHAQAANERGNVGLVVGATYPADLARLRALAPELWFLVPGIGSQGGDLRATLAAGLRPDGLGLLINASRSIASAADPRAAAARFAQEINTLRSEVAPHLPPPTSRLPPPISAVASALLAAGCIRFGSFTLKSGEVSPIYLDLRRLASHPAALRAVARAYAALLSDLAFDRLAGLPYAALPIATAISLEMDRPLIYPRREAKEYGTRAAIEGVFNPGEIAVVIDDLATTGGTKFEAIEKLTAAGLQVHDVVVLVDRQQGAARTLAAAGYTLHAVAALTDLLPEWQRLGAISPAQAEDVRQYLQRAP